MLRSRMPDFDAVLVNLDTQLLDVKHKAAPFAIFCDFD